MNSEEFEKKYKKPGNRFFLIEAKKPVFNRENPQDKRVYWVPAAIQLVIQKNGRLAGREV